MKNLIEYILETKRISSVDDYIKEGFKVTSKTNVEKNPTKQDKVTHNKFVKALKDFGELELKNLNEIFNNQKFFANGGQYVTSMYIGRPGKTLYIGYTTSKGEFEYDCRDVLSMAPLSDIQKIYNYILNN